MVDSVTLALNEPSAANLLDDAGQATGSLLGSLVIVARYRGVQLSKEQLIRDHQLKAGDASVKETIGIAQTSGLRASTTRLRTEAKLPGWPPVVVLRDPNSNEEAPLLLDEARFTAAWAGDVILVKRDYRLRDEDRPFGMGWVAGQLLRDRRVARDLGVCAIILGVLAITPVIFWRVMVDRVMYYGSMSTFTMLCVAFGILLLFETAFGHLRRYLVLFVTTRVDVKIWSHMFNKMLNLPIDFFERTPTGDIVHHMYEIYRVRTFLTGQLFGTCAPGRS